MALLTCEEVVKKNLGLSLCNDFPAQLKSMIETPLNFKIPVATAADPALLKAFLQDAMLAPNGNGRIWFWPDFDDGEDQSQDAVYSDKPLSYRKVRDGNYRFLFKITQNLCLHKAFESHRTRTGRVILLDSNDKFIGTLSSDGAYVMGFRLDMIDTQKLKFSNGTDPSESPILVALKNNLELDRNGVMFSGSFYGELNRLTDVAITVVSSIATKVVVNVNQSCDGTPLLGLVVGDFVMKKASDGTAQTITSIIDNGDGSYQLNGTGLVTGTIELDAAASLSIEAYETLEPTDFTV